MAKHVVVTFGLKVGDAFGSVEEVQTNIKEMKDSTAVQIYK